MCCRATVFMFCSPVDLASTSGEMLEFFHPARLLFRDSWPAMLDAEASARRGPIGVDRRRLGRHERRVVCFSHLPRLARSTLLPRTTRSSRMGGMRHMIAQPKIYQKTA